MISKFLNLFKESHKSFEGIEKDEEVILLLRRHHFVALFPISLLGTVALGPILLFAAFYSLLKGQYLALFLFISSLFYMVLWLMAFYFLMIYTLNNIIVTNKRLIDRDQNRFFDRKVSELHMYRVQDITVSTKGLLPTTIGYGNISVQTAASDKEFVFRDIPNPEAVKDEIMKVAAMANSGLKPL